MLRGLCISLIGVNSNHNVVYLDQHSPCIELVYTDKYHFWHRRASRDKFIDMFIGFCISLIDVNANGAFDKVTCVNYFMNWSNFKLRCEKNGINSSQFFYWTCSVAHIIYDYLYTYPLLQIHVYCVSGLFINQILLLCLSKNRIFMTELFITLIR